MLSRRDDRGSALLMIPTIMLLLVVLGGIAADAAVVTGAQRQLADITAAAANDATAAAIDDGSFYLAGRVRIAPSLAERHVRDAIAAGGPHPFTVHTVRVEVTDDLVVVRASATVEHIFAKAIPGVAKASTVSASSSAVAQSR